MLPIAMALWAATLKKSAEHGDRMNAAADEDLAARRADREYLQGERARTASMRSDVADAAAPRTVDEMPMPQVDDEGNANPLPSRFSTGGTSYADPAQAQTVATAANEPTARVARMSGALEKHGDVTGAQALRTGARQEQVAGLQLDKATRDAVNQKFDDSIDALPTGDFNGIANLISGSRSDGQGGALKVKAVPTADGKKVQFVKINPDGTEAILPTHAYDNTPKGYLEAQLFLKKNVTTEQKLTHLHQVAQEETARAAQQSIDKFHTSMGGYYDKMAEAALTKGDAAMLRAEGGGAGGRKADHYEEKAWDPMYKIEPALVTFTNADTGKAVESPELRLAYNHELNSARESGDMSPTQAAEKARTTVVLLRNKASEMAAASKGKQTEQQAVQQILKEYQKAAAAPAGPAPKGNPNTWPANAPPGGTVRPAATMAAPAAPAGPTVAPRGPAAAAPANNPAEQVGVQLDAARSRFEAANAALQGLGSRQRAANPRAYQQAVAELSQARADRDQLQAQYAKLVGSGSGAAFTPQQP